MGVTSPDLPPWFPRRPSHRGWRRRWLAVFTDEPLADVQVALLEPRGIDAPQAGQGHDVALVREGEAELLFFRSRRPDVQQLLARLSKIGIGPLQAGGPGPGPGVGLDDAVGREVLHLATERPGPGRRIVAEGRRTYVRGLRQRKPDAQDPAVDRRSHED